MDKPKPGSLKWYVELAEYIVKEYRYAFKQGTSIYSIVADYCDLGEIDGIVLDADLLLRLVREKREEQ